MKSGEAVSEKKTFKDYEILYMYIAQEQGQIIKWDKIVAFGSGELKSSSSTKRRSATITISTKAG